MSLELVEEAISWAGREGWEPGLTDAVPFYAADPDGFFSSESEGNTIAVMSAVRGSAKFAFVGLYIVHPDHRGQGFGKPLWDEVLGRFDGFSLGLDAVPEQEATYTSDGFVTAYGNARFSAAELPSPERGLIDGLSLLPARTADFSALATFDGAHFFGPRPEFLHAWIQGEDRESLVMTSGDGRVVGFAASRPSANGHRIGPVFADDQSIARTLILTLAERAGTRVFIDAPLPNTAAVGMLESFGMERSFETRRMYRGAAPELPLERIFGITSLELG